MILNLSLSELCYLDDGLTLFKDMDEREPKVVGRALAPMAISVAAEDLLLKIGTALVHIHEGGLSSFDVDFAEAELWTLREVSQSSMKYNGENVGFSIKMKVYRALMNIRTTALLEGTGISARDAIIDPAIDTQTMLDAYSVLEDDPAPTNG